MNITSGKIVSFASLGGLVVIASFSATDAALRQQSWQKAQEQKAQLESQADLEQTKAEQAKAIAKAYERNQIAHVEALIIRDYTLSDTPPVVDWQHVTDPSRKTLIYDQYRRCIGYAFNGQFNFIQTNNQACEVTP
ncbi:hypothetical protein [Trichocoleus sp. FACHB-262]|uniref:hypothetical protein n=1 Tax=Trichocoleus sp. FACHB-262 TaxID=2692869 RepID=UPI0016880635|nr:hypothetical protein [Trichocoleus sp. FACHB-262]MBD2123957.1 hypothetical protein [Trichocoleus sp. FACHB-262]